MQTHDTHIRPGIYSDPLGEGRSMLFADWSAWLQVARERLGIPSTRAWDISGIEPDPSGWSGADSLDTALDIATNGWRDGTARILSGVDALAPQTEIAQTPAWSYDVAGETPDVAAFCAGEPECMVTPEPEQDQAAPMLTLYVNGAVSASNSADRIENAGIAILTYIQALESAGWSIALHWVNVVNSKTNKTRLTGVPITDHGQELDLDRAAFALAHPAMLRRLNFAIAETRADWRDLSVGHGRPVRDIPKCLVSGDDQSLVLPPMKTLVRTADTPGRALEALQAAMPEHLQITSH